MAVCIYQNWQVFSAVNYIDKELGCVPLGVEADDIDAAIGDSVKLCKAVLEHKAYVLDMKGE